jgi:hypothetical protein
VKIWKVLCTRAGMRNPDYLNVPISTASSRKQWAFRKRIQNVIVKLGKGCAGCLAKRQ